MYNLQAGIIQQCARAGVHPFYKLEKLWLSVEIYRQQKRTVTFITKLLLFRKALVMGK